MPGDDDVDAFRDRNRHWLEDFARFCVIAEREGHRAWWRWPPELARRDPDALDALARTRADAVRAVMARQCAVDRCWQAIRREAAERGIAVFGDMPIFVAHEGVDVWARPGEFLLDEALQPRYVTGVPPDYFSRTGQRWGNPQFDWQRMEADGFPWWRARIERQFSWFDLLRLDHFRGLVAVWMIEARCDTAIEGFWLETPGRALLERLRMQYGALPIVAEDLGYITEDVHALRRAFSLPGMAVLQFAFDHFDDNPHKPANITPDTVVYTGTHDNDTCVGWFNGLQPAEKDSVFQVLGVEPTEDIALLMIETAMHSRAELAIAPLQDFLGLGSEARMNTPGVSTGNWHWQFRWNMLDDGLAGRINAKIADSREAPWPLSCPIPWRCCSTARRTIHSAYSADTPMATRHWCGPLCRAPRKLNWTASVACSGCHRPICLRSTGCLRRQPRACHGTIGSTLARERATGQETVISPYSFGPLSVGCRSAPVRRGPTSPCLPCARGSPDRG